MTSITGIFDAMYVDQLFQKNERGETIFYPFGLMGQGYLLPPEREPDVRGATRRLMLLSLVGGIAFAVLLVQFVSGDGTTIPATWIVGVGGAVLLLGMIVYFQSRLAAGLELASEHPATGEWMRRGRAARPTWTHWFSLGLGVLSLLLAAGGFAGGVATGDWVLHAAGLFFLLVGALLTWDGAMGLVERKRQ